MAKKPSDITVFLDVAIGDLREAEGQENAYVLAQQFWEASRSTFGWLSSLEEVSKDEEQRELFVEAFDADPQWSRRGKCRMDYPDALTKGRLIVQLHVDAAPKACENKMQSVYVLSTVVQNFRCLCTGEKGKGKSSGKHLHYKGVSFHRIMKDFVMQGGDIVKNDGSGGDSIYNGAFKDEKKALALKHDDVGVVAMANSGPHTNRSQFYVTLKPAPQCDSKHVVIGRVINSEGISFLKTVNDVAATESGSPAKDVTVLDCGQL